MMNVCEFAIGTDARGLAVPCGSPAPGRFAFCEAHRTALFQTPSAAYRERVRVRAIAEADDE